MCLRIGERRTVARKIGVEDERLHVVGTDIERHDDILELVDLPHGISELGLVSAVASAIAGCTLVRSLFRQEHDLRLWQSVAVAFIGVSVNDADAPFMSSPHLLVERYLTTNGNWQRINSAVTKRGECDSSVKNPRERITSVCRLFLCDLCY
jgi:hypothetical protein